MSGEKELTDNKAVASGIMMSKSMQTKEDLYAGALMDCVVDGVVGFDRQLRITAWNRNMELHYSRHRNEVNGEDLASLVPELDQPSLLKEVLMGRNVFLKDQSYINRVGFFQAYISPVRDASGKVTGGLAIIHDNTEISEALGKIRAQNEELKRANQELREQIRIREKAELELQQAHDDLEKRVVQRTQQLQASNDELNEFAYVISHDLKAPVRGIASLADWVINDYSDKLDEEGRETLGLLKQSVKRMDHLIKGVLNYYRHSKAGDKTMIDTNSMVREIVSQLNPPSHIRVDIGELPAIMAEEVPLYQVFQNLIDNSLKYMDKPVGEVSITGHTGAGHWQFIVRDNGCGIPEGDQERIFVLFQTGSARNEDSTGIGLSVVRRIVGRMGGKVWVESKQGKGSAFYLQIPFTTDK